MNKRHLTTDEGSVTAEYAVLIPTAVLLLAGAVNAIAFGAHQVRLEEAAAASARQLARGEDHSTVTSTVHHMSSEDTTITMDATGEWATVELTRTAPGPIGWLNLMDLQAQAHSPNQWVTPPQGNS